MSNPWQNLKKKDQDRQFIPHKYQKECILLGLNSAIAAFFLDPGLGKTAISLSIFKILRDKKKIRKTLVIAPLRAIYTVWPAEKDKWNDFKDFSVGILHGRNKDDVLKEDHDLYLINPEGLQWLTQKLCGREYFRSTHRTYYSFIKKYLKTNQFKFEMLVVDESTKFKNSSSQRFKILKGMRPFFKRACILTGTPIPNTLMDIWAQIYILDQGQRLGSSMTYFKTQHYNVNPYNKFEMELKEGAAKTIEKKVHDIAIRKSAADNLDMPGIHINDVSVQLSPASLKVYKQMEKSFFTQIDNDVFLAKNSAIASGKSRQIASGNIYLQDLPGAGKRKSKDFKVVHTDKLDALFDIIEELQGKQVLIAYQFQHELVTIKNEFQTRYKKKVSYLGQGVSGTKSSAIIDQWNSGAISELLGHPRSMGHGLNLQGSNACHIVWYSLPWSSEEYDQFNMRLWRQGQKNTVMIHRLIAKNTIDHAIAFTLASKKRNQEAILDGISMYRASKF